MLIENYSLYNTLSSKKMPFWSNHDRLSYRILECETKDDVTFRSYVIVQYEGEISTYS